MLVFLLNLCGKPVATLWYVLKNFMDTAKFIVQFEGLNGHFKDTDVSSF